MTSFLQNVERFFLSLPRKQSHFVKQTWGKVDDSTSSQRENTVHNLRWKILEVQGLEGIVQKK